MAISKIKILVLSILMMTVVAGSAWAQAVAGMGGISGVVRDESSAAVPGAKVVVSNPSKGITRTLETNSAGVFTAPALVPSSGYMVTTEKEGFTKYEAKDLEVLVGQNVNLNIVLTVGAVATTIEVTGAAPLVEETKTGVSQVVNSDQIQELPINGRRVDSFVLLSPAVVPDGTFGLISFRGIAGGNAYLTDGNDTTNQYYNENAGRTRITTQISQDAVQEFQVMTNGYSAEFGKAAGGVINTVTRSGTNDIHGTAYLFYRNQAFNAMDRYATGGLKPDESRKQFGGSVGGPLKKDKLFYFFNTEIVRRDFPILSSMTRPPLFDSAGNFVGTCGTPATPDQCTAAIKFIQGRGMAQLLPRTANSNLFFLKLDWRPNERHSFSFSGNYLDWISPHGIQTQAVLNNGEAIGNNADSTVRTRYGRASWTSIPTNTMVNELRFGFFMDRLYDDFASDLVAPETGRIGLSVGGQSNLSASPDGGYPRLNPTEQRYQIADNLTWTKGRHTLKLGLDYGNTSDHQNSLRGGYGVYSYSTVAAFAQDFTGNTTGTKKWNSYSQRFGNPDLQLAIRDYNFYLQDQYRVTSKLTLNMGMRYEGARYTQPTLSNPDYLQTAHIPTTNTNFGPRFGFAYALNQGKTVVRGGYGVFFARYTGGLISTFHVDNGVYQHNYSLSGSRAAELAAGPVFPNRLATPPTGGVPDLTYASPGFRNPYTQQGDFGIEHAITKNTGLTVSYIWSRGLKLYTRQDLNIGAPGGPVTYKIQDASGAEVGTYTTPITYLFANRVDKRYGRVMYMDNGGNSYYNALAVQLRRRFSNWWQGSLAYTWAHAIDYNQGGGSNVVFLSSDVFLRSVVNGDYKGEKGSSVLDQRHRLVGTAILSPTFTTSTSAVARFLVNGWQLAPIVTLASAQPTTATLRVSGTPFTGAAYNSTLNGFGGSNRVPFWPLANLDIDQVYRVDVRLTKILKFNDRLKMHINFETFNLFNTISNTFVNAEAYSASGGILKPTAGLGNGSQSQGFPDGTNARRAQISARFYF
jgi:hypothetical protein